MVNTKTVQLVVKCYAQFVNYKGKIVDPCVKIVKLCVSITFTNVKLFSRVHIGFPTFE